MAFIDISKVDSSILVAYLCATIVCGLILGRGIYKLVNYLYPPPTIDERILQVQKRHLQIKCCPRCARRLKTHRTVEGYIRVHILALAAVVVRVESITALSGLFIIGFTFYVSQVVPPERTKLERMLIHFSEFCGSVTNLVYLTFNFIVDLCGPNEEANGAFF